MENVVFSELVIDWNIKYLLGQSANNLQSNRNSVSGSYADYLEIFIQQNIKKPVQSLWLLRSQIPS